MAIILGEENPGFNLWTSAHGFHHLSLSQSKAWRIFWLVILVVLGIALVACIIYYFYYVFTFGVYSRFILESPSTFKWPTTIICDRQFFSSSKLNAIALLTTSHASLLTWTISPALVRPDVINNTRYTQLMADIGTVLARPEYNRIIYTGAGMFPGGPVEMLLRAIAPNCTQLILRCVIGKVIMTGWQCCKDVFDPNPYFTRSGTCYSTRGAPTRPEIEGAGELNSFTITTMHDAANSFDENFVRSNLYGMSGLHFAVVDDAISVPAAMALRAQSVSPAMTASIGLSRTLIENLHLRWSTIGRESCVVPGERDPKFVDADLNYGIDYRYGYTSDSCLLTSKEEMLARELIFCTFSPLPGDNMQRCEPNHAATYYRSFLDENHTASSGVPIVYIDNKAGLRKRYEKKCLPDCVDDRYFTSASYSAMTPIQVTAQQSLMTSSGQNIAGMIPNTVVLKLYMSSTEYQHIHNYPQSGLQFVAEIGGLMSFFFGISVISVIECLLFCCCGGLKRSSESEEEEELRKRQPYVARPSIA